MDTNTAFASGETDFVEALAALLYVRGRTGPPVHTYLELGSAWGNTYNRLAPMFQTAVAVDTKRATQPRLALDANGRHFFPMTTALYIENYVSNFRYDMVYIDAHHSHEAVLADFHGVLPHMVEGGVCILHDTYPRNEGLVGMGGCGTAWEAAWELSQGAGKFWECFTIAQPAIHGLTLIRKRTRQLHWMNP